MDSMGVSKEVEEIYGPEDEIFKLYERIETQVFRPIKIDDIVIEHEGEKVRGTHGDFNPEENIASASFFPSTFDRNKLREALEGVYRVLRGFYGEPTSVGPNKSLVYTIHVGTITKTVILEFDFLEISGYL